jgi:type II secretory pathway component PulF
VARSTFELGELQLSNEPIQIEYPRHGRSTPLRMTRRRRSWWVEVLDAMWSVPVWAIIAIVVVAVPVSGLEYLVGPVLGYPCLVLAVLLIPAAAMAVRTVRRRRAAAVLGYLQQAFRLNLPEERFSGAAAHGEKHPLSRRLNYLQAVLEGGATLSAGLAMAVPELPERSVELIGHAEQIGNLPQTLDRLVDEQLDAFRQPRQDRVLEVWYPPLLLLVAGGLIFFVSLLVAPKYNDIFKDFHLKLPALSAWLMDSFDSLWPAFAALFCIVAAACGFRLREALYISRPSWLWREIKARLLWFVPLIHAALYDRSLADLCTALADSVASGRPLQQALLRAQQLELHPFVRNRVGRWIGRLSAGEPIDRAAHSAGLPALLVGMVNPAGGASIGDALRFLARYYADRSLVRLEVARGMYLPIVTVLMGVMVALVAIGLFLPLERLTVQLGAH